MPPYNPLAASSLLNQQYAAALSLGEEMIRTLFMSERSCAFLYNVRRRSCFSTKWVLCDQYNRVCRQTPEEKSMTKTTLIIFLYLSLLQHSNSPKLAIYLKNEVSCIFMLLQLHFFKSICSFFRLLNVHETSLFLLVLAAIHSSPPS